MKAHEIVIKQYLKKGWIKMNAREKAKINQLEARLKKAKEDREKLDEVIRNIQSQLNTINQVRMI